MAKADIPVDVLRSNRYDPVCVKTGRTHERWIKADFYYVPPWVYLLIFVGLIPLLIVYMIVRKQATVYLPAVDDVSRNRKLVTATTVLGLIAGIVVLFVGGWKSSGGWLLAGLLLFVGSIVVGIVGSQRVWIRGTLSPDESVITLRGAHPDFVSRVTEFAHPPPMPPPPVPAAIAGQPGLHNLSYVQQGRPGPGGPPPQVPPPAYPMGAAGASHRTQRWVVAGIIFVVVLLGIGVAAVLIAAPWGSETVSVTEEFSVEEERDGSTEVLEGDNGNFTIEVPTPWFPDKRLNKRAELGASFPLGEMYVVVFYESADRLPKKISLERYSAFTRGAILDGLGSPSEEKVGTRSIDGYDSLEYELRGTFKNHELVYLHDVLRTETHFVQILAWTVGSHFDENSETLRSVINSFDAK